jgi:hypothetical protein
MRHSRFEKLFGCAALASALWAPLALARPGDLLVELDVPLEFAPQTVCVHVTKLATDLAALRELALKKQSVASSRNLTIPIADDACSARPTPCNACKKPPSDTFGVCVTDPNQASDRRVQLLLENVGLRGMKLEGRNLRMAVDYPESAIVTPRVEVLGSNYHAGDVDSVRSGQDLQLKLRPRCIDRPLRVPATANHNDDDFRLKIVTNERISYEGDSRRAPKLVQLNVSETGLYNHVEVTQGNTVYVASFSYPPPPEISLVPRDFEVSWRKHCLTQSGSMANVCPSASLVNYGHQCDPAPCSSETRNTCCYRCTPERPVEFPTPVRFTLDAPLSGARAGVDDPSLDPVVWEEPIRFPGDEMGGFVASERRRILLNWSNVDNEKRRWSERGAEVSELEIIGPDGRVQRIKRGTASVAAPGLQCHDRFTYRYQGRWFDSPRQSGLRGDTLDLEPTRQRQRELILGIRAHAGGILYAEVSDKFMASPLFDLGLVGLVYGGLELAVSGLFSFHPNVSQFQRNSSDRDMSAFVRVVGGVGYRAYLSDRFLIAPGLGLGVGLPALASDWTTARPSPVVTASAKVGYEITSATVLSGALWLFWPERYMEARQDAAGPSSVQSRSTLAIGLGGGVQWADLL